MAEVDFSPAAVADRLAAYNRWRRGDDVEMPSPADLGRDIDAAVGLLRRAKEEHDPLAFWMLRAANVARQGEWGDGRPPLSPTFRATELAGELGEALNVVKKLERERLGFPGSRATIEDLAAEMADVAICLDLLAMEFGIDLAAAVVAKFDATSARMGLATRLGEGRISDDHNGDP